MKQPPDDDHIQIAAINERGRRMLEPSNTPHYKSVLALEKATERLFATTPISRIAHIILATTQYEAKEANKKWSRIQEYLRRCGISTVWHFHRSISGRIHWHLLAALPYPVVEDYDCGQSTSTILHYLDLRGWEAVVDRELTSQSRALRTELARKMKQVGLGHVVKIQPILYADGIGRYCARWQRGSSVRFRGDKHCRLWGASKRFRGAAGTKVYIDTEWSRIARLKNAAYCEWRGWRSFEQARDADTKWQYHAREFLKDKLVGLYVFEEDFAFHCDIEFSPALLGVKILHTNVSLGLPQIPYVCTALPTAPHMLERLQKVRRRILPLSHEHWQRGGL